MSLIYFSKQGKGWAMDQRPCVVYIEGWFKGTGTVSFPDTCRSRGKLPAALSVEASWADQ